MQRNGTPMLYERAASQLLTLHAQLPTLYVCPVKTISCNIGGNSHNTVSGQFNWPWGLCFGTRSWQFGPQWSQKATVFVMPAGCLWGQNESRLLFNKLSPFAHLVGRCYGSFVPSCFVAWLDLRYHTTGRLWHTISCANIQYHANICSFWKYHILTHDIVYWHVISNFWT
jgi:hypothetical protein